MRAFVGDQKMDAAAAQARPQRVAFGVTLIIAAVFGMSVQDALFKLFSADMSLWQIFTLRGLLALPLFFLLALVLRPKRNILIGALRKWPLVRSLLMTVMFMAFYAAMPFLNLSTVATGIYTAPIFVTLLSAFVVGEPVGARGWVAIAIGFLGVLVILQPGTDAFSLWAMLPLFGGFSYALANIVTRTRCQHVPLPEMSLSLNLMMLLAGVVLSLCLLIWQPVGGLASAFPYLFDGWTTLGPLQWLVLALLAVFVVVIGMGLAGAYQSAPSSLIATFDYSYLVFAALWDLLIFSTVPTATTALGIILIMGAGLLVLRR